MVYLLKMLIFYIYVKLPEGKYTTFRSNMILDVLMLHIWHQPVLRLPFSGSCSLIRLWMSGTLVTNVGQKGVRSDGVSPRSQPLESMGLNINAAYTWSQLCQFLSFHDQLPIVDANTQIHPDFSCWTPSVGIITHSRGSNPDCSAQILCF